MNSTASAIAPHQLPLESKQWFGFLLDHSPEAVLLFDASTGRFSDANKSALKLLSRSLDELVKLGPAEISPAAQPDGRHSANAMAAQIAAAVVGNAPAFPWVYLSKQGNELPCEVRLVRLPSSGNILCYSLANVTQRHAAEQALRETARRLEDAQRVAKIGSWELDLVSGALTWSSEIHRIFEIDADRFGASYQDFLVLVHPEDREVVDTAYHSSLERKEPYDIEHRLLMPDGRVKWVHERCESEFDSEGRPLRSRGTVQDITHRKSVEDALRESEATVAAFLRASPEAVIITDAATRIKVFSAGAEVVFGYQAREVIGREIECLMPERARAGHHHHVRAFGNLSALGKMIDERSEIVGLRKDGKEFPAEASLAKLKTPSGVFFAILLRDVTQQKIARTELLNAKLAAEAANEAKSRFIANMSHELRTPLNAIIGFSQILAASAVDSAKVQAYGKDIYDSGKHLLGIINDILQISRMELGGLSPREEEVCLEEVVEACVRIVGDRAREAGLRLDIEFPRALPLLWVDRRLLVQAVLNLLTNAIKFTEREGTVTIGVRQAANGGVDIYVHDTGIGMAPEDVARIGQPFMQADNRLERRYDGTGLGLVITKRLAELHDGALVVQSAVGLGTIVSICLPAARVRGPTLQSVRPAPVPSISSLT